MTQEKGHVRMQNFEEVRTDLGLDKLGLVHGLESLELGNTDVAQ